MTKTELKIDDILQEFGDDFVKYVKNQLQRRNKVASGKLFNSIGFTIRELQNSTVLTIKYADYLKFVDKGVNGTERNNRSPYSFKPTTKFINIRSLTKWVSIKGLPKNSVFPIARSIAKRGIEGENFLENYEDSFYREIVQVLNSELPQSIEKDIMVQLVL